MFAIFETLDRFALLSFGLGAFSVITLLFSFRYRAPYGRYAINSASSWGPQVPGKLAWCIQELPCVLWAGYFLFMHTATDAGYILIVFFLIHYVQRTFIFSFLIQGGKPTRLLIFLSALLFCALNGYLQCGYLSQIFNHSLSDTAYLPFFIAGSILFFAGMMINIKADHMLRMLRKPGEKDYKIPRGFLFKYVSAANFFGEIMEWVGFSVASAFSLPSMAFALSTFVSIGLRGYHHHRHYQEIFPDYPKDRKAVIPFLW